MFFFIRIEKVKNILKMFLVIFLFVFDISNGVEYWVFIEINIFFFVVLIVFFLLDMFYSGDYKGKINLDINFCG